MNRSWLATVGFALLACSAVPAEVDPPPSKKKAGAAADPAALAAEARTILKQHCHRCHAGPGSKGGKADFLNRADLLLNDRVQPGNPDDSYLLERIISGEMPPPGEKPRPVADDIAAMKKWIEAGAAEFPAADKTRPFVPLKTVLAAVRDDLKSADASDRRFLHFTLHTFANDPATSDADLGLARAALSKAANSLSDRAVISLPRSVDAARLVFAIDVRDFGWDRDELWQNVELAYPYGLRDDHHPDADLAGSIKRCAS